MPPASFVALYPKCFANFRSTVGHVTFTLLWWLLFSAVIVFIHGATTMSFIEIPCDVNMINITTTMASNTTYLITNCTLDGLPPTFDGGWMPPIHRFEAMLSTVAPPSSLMNVRIMVQGGNVLPIIKIWPAVGIAGPVSTLLSVINVSVELVNISVVWPATIAPNVVDSIFAVLFAYMRNISLTLRDCSLELHYPSSLVMNSNPILLWILGPLLLLSDDSGTTINMTSSGVSLFVAASRVVIHSQRNTTPSRLFLLEMLAGGVLTNVTILVTQQSTVTILASIWFHLQTVAVMGVQYQRNAGFIAADSQMSHVNFRVSDRSIITLVGILPLEGTTPINDTDVTLMCMQVSSCSDIYVGVEGASFLNMTLVRSTVGEASLMAMTVRRHQATIARFDVAQTAQHVRLVCRNSTTLLRAATKAILFAISAQFMVDVNATISHAVTTQEATAGLAGQQGKVATCVTLSSGVTSTEFGSTPIGIQGSVIHVEHTRIHVVVAADGALNSAISAVYLASDNVFTETGIFVDNVTMVSSVVGSTLSPFMFGAAPLSISVLLFTSTCTLVWLSGNVTAAAVDVQQSRLETAQQFLVVGFSATQLTASVVSILFVPGAVASSTIVITDCNVVMTVVTGAEDDGRGAFGANPPLPAGSTQGWNGNMVNIIATMTQRAASKMINAAPSVLTAFLSSASNATSLFDRVLIVMSRVVISPSTLPKNPSFLGQSASVIVSMLGLADTTLRNVVVNMTNVSVFSTTATELGAVSDMRSCTRQNITALGFGHGFASLISILGQCTMASNTTVVVNGAAGVMGPAISGYSVTQNAAALTLYHSDARSLMQFQGIVARGVESEGSIFGKHCSSQATSSFAINVMMTTSASSSTLTTNGGISLSASFLCGFGALTDQSSSVAMLSSSSTPMATPILSLLCNVWAPVPLATLLEVSSPQLPSAYVATPLPGNDWDASCPQLLVEGVSHTTTAFPVIAPPTYPIPAVRSATSVITGAVIAAGSLVGVGSQGGGVHGIQIAMLVIHVQTLCAANEGNVNHGEEASIATPDDLCCDLGTSPTQLSFDDYGGVYLGGVLGNTILVMGSTMMRFIAGKMLLRLPQLDEKDPNCVKRILRHMRSLAPPSGPVTLSWTAYMFLLCPTVSLCVALASDGTMPAYARWMGGLVLPLWLMPWAGAFFGLCWWGRRVEFAFYGEAQRKRKQQSSTRKAQKEARTTTTFFGNVHDWLLKETEELKPLRRHALQAAKQLRLFGSVFASYRAARHWAFNVEVFFAFVAGTIAGLFLLRASSALCSGSAWGWAVVAVGIAETTTAVALQAFSLRLELVCFVLVMLFTIVSEIVALVYPDESDAANALSTVAAVLQAFLMMYGTLEHFHLRLRVRISLSGAFFSAGRGHALGEFHLEALPKLSPPLTMTRHTQHQPLAFDGSDKTSRFRSREEALERLLKLICESQNVRPLTHE